MPPSSGTAVGPAAAGTLQAALVQGALPLGDALLHAVRIAVQLRELHGDGLAHGDVSTRNVVLGPEGAELVARIPGTGSSKARADVRGWGAIVFEMLTGSGPPAGERFAPREADFYQSGPSALRPTAERLAMNCLVEEPYVPPTMQRVLAEIRVLAILARQYGLSTGEAVSQQEEAARTAAPLPYLVEPLQKLAQAVEEGAPAVPAPHAIAGSHALALAAMATPPPGEPAPTAPARKAGEELPQLTRPVVAAPAEAGPCPRCGGKSIYISMPRTRFERALAGWAVPICRCHCCYHRWILIGGLRLRKSMPAARKYRKKQELL